MIAGMIENQATRALIEEIKRRLGDRSQQWLADSANLSQSTISKLLRGQHQPTPETLDAIGQVLGVDPLYLMRLAGLPLPAPAKDRHPTAEYISQKLSELPPALKEHAIEAVAGVVDQFARVADGLPANGAEPSLSLNKIAQSERLSELERLRTIVDDLMATVSHIHEMAATAIQDGETEAEVIPDKERPTPQSITEALKVLPKAIVEKILREAKEAMERTQQQIEALPNQ